MVYKTTLCQSRITAYLKKCSGHHVVYTTDNKKKVCERQMEPDAVRAVTLDIETVCERMLEIYFEAYPDVKSIDGRSLYQCLSRDEEMQKLLINNGVVIDTGESVDAVIPIDAIKGLKGMACKANNESRKKMRSHSARRLERKGSENKKAGKTRKKSNPYAVFTAMRGLHDRKALLPLTVTERLVHRFTGGMSIEKQALKTLHRYCNNGLRSVFAMGTKNRHRIKDGMWLKARKKQDTTFTDTDFRNAFSKCMVTKHMTLPVDF